MTGCTSTSSSDVFNSYTAYSTIGRVICVSQNDEISFNILFEAAVQRNGIASRRRSDATTSIYNNAISNRQQAEETEASECTQLHIQGTCSML